ncbi:MAG: aldehyde dehydrogenase family protein, partial [Devosia sp.]|nr:aldehyde dehydrogenase family protein [Devosia sp.]
MGYQSLNPFDGKIIGTFEGLSNQALEAKIAAAEACFKTWRHTSFAERARIIAKAGALMHAKAGEFARIMTL